MFGMTPRRVLIWLCFASLVHAASQYIPVLFYAWEFDDFVRDEVRFTPVRESIERDHLADHILQQARLYKLILDDKGVQVTKTRDPRRGIRVLAVEVGYRAPVDLYYFVHEIRFQVRASTFY